MTAPDPTPAEPCMDLWCLDPQQRCPTCPKRRAAPDTADVDALTEGELHGLRSIFAGRSTMPNGLREVVEVIVADRVAEVRRDTAEQAFDAIEHALRRYGSRGGNSPQWVYAAVDTARARIAREAGTR